LTELLILSLKSEILNLLIELHYLPSLEYFCTLLQFDEIQLEKHEHYVKQSYRNRCHINTAHGIDMLVIPLTAKHGKTVIRDIRIDYSKKWQNNHWRTIESAYRKAPYFEYYSDDLRSILYSNKDFLFDLNLEFLSFCLKSLRFNPTLSVSVSYEKEPTSTVFDLRSQINPKNPVSERNFYKPVSYYQVFGSGFVENLSLIDLLFCEGPRAASLLLASQKEDLNK
jgi:WbqC-like protein family